MAPQDTQEDAAKVAADKATAAEAEKAKKADTDNAKKGVKVVRYIGTADERSISAAAFKNIGVEDQGQLSWSKKNHFEVPASDISASALRYLDEDDDGFEIVDV